MKDLITPNMDIRAVLFDFGGVIADEGFKHGLLAIAASHGLDGENFIKQTRSLIYSFIDSCLRLPVNVFNMFHA